MRFAVITSVLLLASASAVAQLGDVEVPDPTGALPEPDIEIPAIPDSPIPEEDPDEQQQPPPSSNDPADPLHQYQTLVWEDGRALPAPDAFDLLSLRIWEANLMADPANPLAPSGAGIMARLHIAGGDRAEGYDKHTVAGGIFTAGEPAGQAVTITFNLVDDPANAGAKIWQADETYIKLFDQATTDGAVLVPDLLSGPADHILHFFIPLSAIGAAHGDTVRGWSFVSQSIDDEGDLPPTQFDSAPDDSFLIRDADDVDNATVEEKNGTADYFVQGSGHHLNVSGRWSNELVSMVIHNPYDEPQTVTISAPAGAAPRNASTAEILANASMEFLFDAPRTSQARDLLWDVRSDTTKGLAQMQLKLPALPAAPAAAPSTGGSGSQAVAPAPAPVQDIGLDRTDVLVAPPDSGPMADDPPIVKDKDSPGGAWVGLAAIGAVVVAIRRRH